MHIYCAGPIRGDTTYSSFYGDIVEIVRDLGHVPLAELVLLPEEIAAVDDRDIYRRDIDWLGEARAMIAEVSAPSLGVGYEIAYALHVCKIPVLCLRNTSSGRLSAMISGNDSELLGVEIYESRAQLVEKVREFLEEIITEGV